MNSVTCPNCGHHTPVLAAASGAAAQCLRCRATIPAEFLKPHTGEPAADAPPGYPVQPFTGVPGGTPTGAVVAIVIGAIGAVPLGIVTAFIEQFLWFVLLFAALYGLALGGVTGAGAWLARYRVKSGAYAAGAVVGLIGLFTLHYSSYRIAVVNNPQIGFFSFWEFLDLRCEAGTKVGGIELGYVGSVIYWLAEGLVAVLTSAGTAAWAVNRPFCAGCNTWKEKRTLGTFKINGPLALEAVAAGRPEAVAAPAVADDKVTLSLYECPRCRPTGGVEVETVCVRGTGQQAATVKLCLSYPGDATAAFEAAATACRQHGETK